MGTVNDPFNFAAGQTAKAEEVDARFSTLFALVNGQIDGDNIRNNAVPLGKLDVDPRTRFTVLLFGSPGPLPKTGLSYTPTRAGLRHLFLFQGSGFRLDVDGKGPIAVDLWVDGVLQSGSPVFTNETASHKATVFSLWVPPTPLSATAHPVELRAGFPGGVTTATDGNDFFTLIVVEFPAG